MSVKRPFDFSAHVTAQSLPERLRHLAAAAEEAGVTEPDVYGNAPGLQRFEAEVAELLGKQEAAFFVTGTLAQRAALHAHLQQMPPGTGRVIVHPTSHLVHHACLLDGKEQAKRARTEAKERLPAFSVEFVGELHRGLAFADFESQPLKEGDVVVVELPQRCNGGRTMAWTDLEKLAALVRRVGARLHMDGARLWEVQPFYARPFHEICGLFDSVYVSFYKGLGGMSGAMLCGEAGLLQAARAWRERLGGSVFSFAPAWLDAQSQLRQRAHFAGSFAKLQEVVKALSADAAVRQVLRFEPPAPEACLIHGYVRGAAVEALEAIHGQVTSTTGCRLWNRLRGRGYCADPCAEGEVGSGGEFYFEWNMGPANAELPVDAFLSAWKAFAAAAAPADSPAT